MSFILPPEKSPGNPITASDYNLIIKALRILSNISGGHGVDVAYNVGGVSITSQELRGSGGGGRGGGVGGKRELFGTTLYSGIFQADDNIYAPMYVGYNGVAPVTDDWISILAKSTLYPLASTGINFGLTGVIDRFFMMSINSDRRKSSNWSAHNPTSISVGTSLVSVMETRNYSHFGNLEVSVNGTTKIIGTPSQVDPAAVTEEFGLSDGVLAQPNDEVNVHIGWLYRTDALIPLHGYTPIMFFTKPSITKADGWIFDETDSNLLAWTQHPSVGFGAGFTNPGSGKYYDHYNGTSIPFPVWAQHRADARYSINGSMTGLAGNKMQFAGNWVTEGFAVDDEIFVQGSLANLSNGKLKIKAITTTTTTNDTIEVYETLLVASAESVTVWNITKDVVFGCCRWASPGTAGLAGIPGAAPADLSWQQMWTSKVKLTAGSVDIWGGHLLIAEAGELIDTRSWQTVG